MQKYHFPTIFLITSTTKLLLPVYRGIIVQEALCHHCQHPVNKGEWPQNTTDYPSCWQEWEKGYQFLSKNKKDSLHICNQCHSLWLLTWNYREVFLEAIKLPKQLSAVLEQQNSLELIWQLLLKHSKNHYIRVFLLNVAKNRFTQGNINCNIRLLVKFLSDTSLPIKTAGMAISLLHSVLGTVARKPLAQTSQCVCQSKESLSCQIERNINGDENIVVASEFAYKKYQVTQAFHYLRPVHDLNIKPLLYWLEISPKANNRDWSKPLYTLA